MTNILQDISSGLLICDDGLLTLLSPMLYDSNDSRDEVWCSVPFSSIEGISEKATTDTPRIGIASICGAMCKYSSGYITGTQEIAQCIETAVSNNDVDVIVLSVDSPGGTIASVPPLLAALDFARQRGVVLIGSVDTGCSAAYWVLSCCDFIYATNTISSRVGSIGAMVQWVDSAQLFEKIGIKNTFIFPDESSEKNLPFRNALEGDFSLIKKDLSESANMFIADVKHRRPCIVDGDGIYTGRVFSAKDALENKMIDGILSLNELISFIPTLIFL